MRTITSILLLGVSVTITAQTNIFPDNGNTGIGTTNPNQKLEVNAIGSTHALFKGSFSGIQGIQVERMSGDNIRLVTNYAGFGGGLESTSKLRFAVDGNDVNSPSMIINELGRVGIGTTSPEALLDVEGSLSILNGAERLLWSSKHVGASDHRSYLAPRMNDDSAWDWNQEFGYHFFHRAWYFNGDVGIGTATPDAKLAVKGNIHAEEVKVDLSVPGPDYVFKEGYDLKSLEEVQNHIKEHGHLPNIPSAKEMEANGIQLGEMNMKLLEKIEELTLYTLSQEKKLIKVNEKMEQQNKEIETLKQLIKNLCP
ncbi:hypothetical protein [Flagellimonas sp.]|uniref:hypothetical protein n=1 Tax=Flagellimonas sp. TaxID=2058762 RepID=UPI003AB78299